MRNRHKESVTHFIYPTYVINVASETPFEKVGRISGYTEFVSIKDDVMYLKTTDNILVTTSINTKN